MRHLKSGFKLGRNPAHRRATLRNLVTNLIERERIETTIRRAKAAQPLAERMITLGVEPVGEPYDKAEAFFDAELARWKDVIDRAGIKLRR